MHLKQAFQHQARQVCELRLRRSNGMEFYARLESIGVWDSQGNFSHYRTIVSDISKRKRMEEELQRTQKLKSVGVMAGDIAHEFKNILMIIVSVLSLAKMHLDAERAKGVEAVGGVEGKVFDLLSQAENAAMRAKDFDSAIAVFFQERSANQKKHLPPGTGKKYRRKSGKKLQVEAPVFPAR